MRVLPSVLTLSMLALPIFSSAQVVDVPAEELYAGGPEAPIILSTDMPIVDTWYQPQEASFHWGLPADVTAVAADLYIGATREPMTSYRPPVTSITIKADEWVEGPQYLSVQFRNFEKWGNYSERQILIDGTPPEPFVLNVKRSSVGVPGVIVTFSAKDALSGISHYGVRTGAHEVTLTSQQALDGFFVPLTEESQLSINVVAYDGAGNTREASTVIYPFKLETVTTPLNVAELAAEEPASILAALMAALLLIMFGYMVFERQRYAGAIVSLREESEEAQTQIMRIFNALRSEIYDQINAIDGKTRLSKKEKEAVASLSNALKVSEKLLKKEVKDIKKLL